MCCCLTQRPEVLVSHVVHLRVQVTHLGLQGTAEVLLLAKLVQKAHVLMKKGTVGTLGWHASFLTVLTTHTPCHVLLTEDKQSYYLFPTQDICEMNQRSFLY